MRRKLVKGSENDGDMREHQNLLNTGTEQSQPNINTQFLSLIGVPNFGASTAESSSAAVEETDSDDSTKEETVVTDEDESTPDLWSSLANLPIFGNANQAFDLLASDTGNISASGANVLLKACVSHGTFDVVQAGKILSRVISSRIDVNSVVSKFVREYHQCVHETTLNISDVTDVSKYLALGNYLMTALHFENMNSLLKATSSSSTSTPKGDEHVYLQRELAPSDVYAIPSCPPFVGAGIDISKFAEPKDANSVGVLTSMLKFILRQACNPISCIQQYTYRTNSCKGSKRGNPSLKDLPEPIFEVLREFSLTVFGLSRREVAEHLSDDELAESRFYRGLGPNKEEALARMKRVRNDWLKKTFVTALQAALADIRASTTAEVNGEMVWFSKPKKRRATSTSEETESKVAPSAVSDDLS